MKHLLISVLLGAFSLLLTSGCGLSKHEDSPGYLKEELIGVAPYGDPSDVKARYVKALDSDLKTEVLFDREQLRESIQNFNQISLEPSTDPVDVFISRLPKNYRRHFTMIHRSFSIQEATPMAPRVVLFGPHAKVVMTFNAGPEYDGKKLAGGETIEIMEYDSKAKEWHFSELSFDKNKKAKLEEHPAKCVMCHSGTPKAVELSQAPFYKGKLKPIFPQYPFWPGFYGSVNDIVGLEAPGSKDTIMRNLPATIKQIKDLTFSDTEELFRIRELLDKNPQYVKVIENELKVHQKHFIPLMDSLSSRPRYKHLLTLKDLYSSKEKVPDSIKTSPYRRTFNLEYGHYIQRPNFYLSSLLTFYQSDFVANEILKFPEFSRFKYSLLARKYNCGPVSAGNLKITDLDPSFDLVYPNIADPQIRDRQYLLSYQYNLVSKSLKNSAQQTPAALPLYSWNLESNEDIASYHYGNVFSDLNELVLWKLTTKVFPNISINSGRSAAQDRHFELPQSKFMKDILENKALGFVSKMNPQNFEFSNSLQNYYGQAIQLKAQPTSSLCAQVLLPAAKKELEELAKSATLPHHAYPLDQELVPEQSLLAKYPDSKRAYVRQSCEACHTAPEVSPEKQIKVGYNVDWYSDNYHLDLQKKELKDGQPLSHADFILTALSETNLPVPYGNRMPFARKEADNLSQQCEELIVKAAASLSMPLKGDPYMCKSQGPDSLACDCLTMMKKRDSIYRKYHPKQKDLTNLSRQ